MALVRKETHYETLGLERSCQKNQIRSQFEALEDFWKSLAFDSPMESELKLMELRTAFSILSDSELRSSYDDTLDFEFVLLDGKTKDSDIEEAYDVFRQKHQKTYQEIISEFQAFKDDLGSSLWLLKTTTLYLIFSIFVYSGIVLILTIISEQINLSSKALSQMKLYLVPLYLLASGVGYHFFRKYFQFPSLKKRKNLTKGN